MSKKLLRDVVEKTGKKIEQHNKKYKLRIRYPGKMRVGNFNLEEQKVYQEAEKAGNTTKIVEIIDLALANPTELYFNMPSLKISDNGSIKSLAVCVYSAQVNDNNLLHKLFGKMRE